MIYYKGFNYLNINIHHNQNMKISVNIFRLVFLFVLWIPNMKSIAQEKTLALVGAKIYPAPFEKPIMNGVVIIENGKIIKVGTNKDVKIPAAARIIDCTGLVMMSGFWNCHVHFMEPHWQGADRIPVEQLNHQLKSMLTRYGFTYAFDLATLDINNLLALRNRISKEEVDGPTILTAGVPFTPENGSPFYIAPLKLPEISTPDHAREYVNGQLDAGADAIKLWSASPDGKKIITMPVEIINAATEAAHKRGKPVFAHPTNLEGVKIAQQGGVDILAHVAADDLVDWDQQTISAMLSSKMALIPTLKLHKWELERAGQSSENHLLTNTAIRQLSSYSMTGGEILFGTDVGYMTDYSPEDEYILMGKAGMNFFQILAALTTTPARRFGLDKQSGSIAEGMDADLVLLSADPAIDVKHFADVKYTIRKGRIIYRD